MNFIMRYLITLLFAALSLNAVGQNVYIPDANFKAYLVGNSAININGDGEIQVSEATAFGGDILCSSMNISDLTGIENFTALTLLRCFNNQLTSLDLSNTTSLTILDCGANQLTSLDLSNTTSLTILGCGGNQLTSLDLSNNAYFSYLVCNNNQLTSLDLSNNANLTELVCSGNQLTSLDLRNGNNINLQYGQANLNLFDVTDNPLLYCVLVDDISYSFTNWALENFDSFVNFETSTSNCALGKTYVPDNNFEQALIDLGYDDLLDDSLQTAAIDDIISLWIDNKNIADLTGIEDFSALTQLVCSGNQLTSLYLYNNSALTELHCGENQMTTLDISNLSTLTNLSCSNNYLECLDISNLSTLTNLSCGNNLLEQLNLKNGNFLNMSVNAISNNLFCVEVDNIGIATNNWSFDSFTSITTNCNYTDPCATISAIQENAISKELIKITDALGRDVNHKTNQILFHIYNDGSVEKKFVVE